jgi:ribosomal protein S18 acetylase RimI-like enzyme
MPAVGRRAYNEGSLDCEGLADMRARVRRATTADAQTIAPLFDAYRQFYRQPADLPLALAFVRERLSLGESVIFLAEDEQARPVGFTQLYPSFTSIGAGRLWILNDLFVVPPARGQGVGHALLNAAKAHAVETRAKRLVLSTAHDNPAQKLYESAGYVRDRHFRHYSLAVD